MYKRLISLPLEGEQSIFLFGPRASGKNFWLKRELSDSYYIDSLDAEVRFDLEVDLSRLKRYIGSDIDKWIVIDEVQKVPEILDEVHRL